jgi:hypothetical protein
MTKLRFAVTHAGRSIRLATLKSMNYRPCGCGQAFGLAALKTSRLA